jgi:uncharacterized protein
MPARTETLTTETKKQAAQTALPRVTFARSQKSVIWDGAHESLLELAEAAGLSPAYSCRAGVCSTCISGLLSGDVVYSNDPLDPPEEGRVLICCSRPVGDVTLDF